MEHGGSVGGDGEVGPVGGALRPWRAIAAWTAGSVLSFPQPEVCWAEGLAWTGVPVGSAPMRRTDETECLPGYEAAAARQAQLTKPPGSLGGLETVALELAGIQGVERPVARPAAALLFASDHPVVRHGVAAFPASVTAGMVANFAAGGAAASVAALQVHRMPLAVHDVGVDTPYELPADVAAPVQRHMCADLPAGDLRTEDAMSPKLFAAALEAGRSAVEQLEPQPKILILGEMGIGNTTPASAVAAALLGRPATDLAWPGTGLDADGISLKATVIAEALSRLESTDPMEVLRVVGGRELAALAGAALAAHERGIAVLVDGFIVTAAIYAAVRHEPGLRWHLLFGHRSGEPGHALLLEAMGAKPLLDLGLRLGEGSGALAAYGLVELSCALHGSMATFAEAGLEGGPPPATA